MTVRKYKKIYIYNKKWTYDKILKIINDIFLINKNIRLIDELYYIKILF